MKSRHILALAAAILSGLAAFFFWQVARPPGGAADRASVELVIQSQLAAIRAGDFATAFSFAAEPLQRRFNPETFGIMVRNGYAKLVDSVSGQVVDVEGTAERVVVLVRIDAKRGPPSFFQYELARESRGWRILGVTEVPAPYVTV